MRLKGLTTLRSVVRRADNKICSAAAAVAVGAAGVDAARAMGTIRDILIVDCFSRVGYVEFRE